MSSRIGLKNGSKEINTPSKWENTPQSIKQSIHAVPALSSSVMDKM